MNGTTIEYASARHRHSGRAHRLAVDPMSARNPEQLHPYDGYCVDTDGAAQLVHVDNRRGRGHEPLDRPGISVKDETDCSLSPDTSAIRVRQFTTTLNRNGSLKCHE